MLHLILGPSGSGKTYWIRQRIAEAVREGRDGILYLVPEQSNFESERAVLTLLGSASTDVVEVVSFTRLAEGALGAAGTVKEAAPDSIKVMMMGRAFREVKSELTVYARQGDSPEFCRSVLELDEELRRSRISTEDLCSAASAVGGTLAARVKDLSLLISAYRAVLGVRFRDPVEDLDRLTAVLDEQKLFAGKTVFLDSFKGFTEQQFAVLDRLLVQAKDVFIALLSDGLDDPDGGMGLFSNVKRTAARLIQTARENGVPVAAPLVLTEDHRFGGNRLRNLERFLRAEAPDPAAEGGSITVCSCVNAVDEADYVARTIRRLVRCEGYRYRDFAVVARHIEECQALLTNACERYRIPCFNDRRVGADSLALIRFTLNAIDCALHAYPGDAIYSLIKSELSPLTVEEASELESYALMWQKRGQDWLADWEENPNGLEGDFDRERLDRILSARRRVTEPVETLGAALRSGQPKVACRAVYETLRSLEVDSRLAAYADRLDREGDSYFADLHRQSWDVMMSALDAVVRALEGDRCEAEEFIELFSMLLSASDLGAIPDRLDEVVVGSADHIRMASPRVIFVIGANYGVLPASTKPGGLLSGHDRRRLIRNHLKMPDFAAEQMVDERFMVYAVLTAASERLIITYRNADLKGEKMLPAEFVEDICKGLADAVTVTTSSATADDAFEGVLPAVEHVSGARPALTRALSDQLRAREDPRGSLLESALRPTASAVLSPDTARRLFGTNVRMSASRAETYEKCPFSYFCKYGVKARPDPSADWGNQLRGTLVHEVLEKMLRVHGADLATLPAEDRRTEVRALIRDYADGHFPPRDRVSADFAYRLERAAVTVDDVLVRLGEELAQSDFCPDRFEQPIGEEGSPSLSVPLSDGSVSLKGKIDRVDVYRADGKTYVRIVDYKTGSETFDLADLLSGEHMQMLFYLFAVIDSGLYENALPAGILYQHAARTVVPGADAADLAAVRKAQDKNMRMSGLLLDDPVSLTAMERDGQGRFIPYSPEGKNNAVASLDEFKLIREYILHRIAQLGERLHRGEVGVEPLTIKKRSACKYCDYADVCRYGDSETKTAETVRASQALACMAEEVGSDAV